MEENTCMGIPRRGLAAGAAGPPGRGRAHADGRSFDEKEPRGCSGGQKIRMCSVLRAGVMGLTHLLKLPNTAWKRRRGSFILSYFHPVLQGERLALYVVKMKGN